MATKTVKAKVYTNKRTGQKSVMIPDEGFEDVGKTINLKLKTERKKR